MVATTIAVVMGPVVATEAAVVRVAHAAVALPLVVGVAEAKPVRQPTWLARSLTEPWL